MSNEKLFIPKKIKIGFQERKDTYTGKLGYVIYYDNLGKLRKETSWESWRSDDIDPIEVDNDPVEGFVINRGAGGVRESWGWNARQEYVRVYDPREWEFEINIPNLLFILRECNCNKGKGLEGKFVYAWAGTQLVMLPVDTPEYRKSMAFTEIQGKKIAKADLVQGRTYLSTDAESITYIGRYQKYNGSGYRELKGMVHVFWGEGDYRFYETKHLKKIAVVSVAECHPELANMTTAYLLSKHGSPIVKYDLMKSDIQVDQWGREYHWYRSGSGFHCYCFDKEEGCYYNSEVNSKRPENYHKSYSRDKARRRSNRSLVAILESGSVYKVSANWGVALHGEDIREEYSEYCRRSDTNNDSGGEEAACGDCTSGTAILEN